MNVELDKPPLDTHWLVGSLHIFDAEGFLREDVFIRPSVRIRVDEPQCVRTRLLLQGHDPHAFEEVPCLLTGRTKGPASAADAAAREGRARHQGVHGS